MKTAVVIGSSGLVGSELIQTLQASPHYDHVLLLNRRTSGMAQTKISERIIDFEAPDLTGVVADDFYCALGTTLRKAGSQAAQYAVDHDYPCRIAAGLKALGVKRIGLVSSVGADARAGSFYLRTKGQLEEAIVALGFEQTVIARPSVLIGKRAEFRFGEEVAISVLRIFSPLLFGGLRKYQGVEARAVARCLVQAVTAGSPGVQVIESDQIREN